MLCSGQNLSNSLCQFWNNKSIPLQILYLSPVSWKIIPLYFSSSKNIYFAQKEPTKMTIFEIFECLDQILSNSSCQFWNEDSIPLKFCIPLQFHERLLLCTFLAKTIYTLLIRSPLKWKSLRLSSARVKICQIPYANFETACRFLSKFCIPLQFHER